MRGAWGFNRRRGLGGLLAALVAIGAGATAWADDKAGDLVLTGTVVDEAGKPVAGAEVRATNGQDKIAPVKSAPDGSFRLALPLSPMGRIGARLVVNAGGRLGLLLVVRDPEEAEKAEPVKVVVKPSRAIEVRVVDRDGRPIEGADVHFLSNHISLVGGQTDADGRWTANAPADAGVWAVYALKSKAGFDYVATARTRASLESPPPLPERLTLILDGARPPLRVKAVDEAGKPLTGARVGPWYIKKPGRESSLNDLTDAMMLRTDADGVATFDWLPQQGETVIPMLARSASRYLPGLFVLVPQDKPADEMTLGLKPFQRLSGRVTTADGWPAAGATVQAEGCGESSGHGFQGLARTDADGRYAFDVHGEEAYIITAMKGELAAPYRSGLVVRTGKPIESVDLVLGPATHVKGRVTVGDGRKPAPKVRMTAVIDKGSIPPELKIEGDRVYHPVRMSFSQETDDEGRYDFRVGPGEYTIRGPAHAKPVELTIPTQDPPLEVVHDFSTPRPETGPFTATVVDAGGKPVAGAVLNGHYVPGASRGFPLSKTDARGVVRIERAIDPLLLHAETPDHSLAAIERIDAEATEARIVVRPTATASGRIVDAKGQPLAGRALRYEIRARLGSSSNSYVQHRAGNVTTDGDGRFTLGGLVVGARYETGILQAREGKIPELITAEERFTPTAPGPFDAGDLVFDLEPRAPREPYVPPTPAQRAGNAFAASKEKSPRERLDGLLVEAAREYTRPLLLFGGPSDPACVELFRVFAEPWGLDRNDEARPRSPSELRCEFEPASLDATRPDVRAFAKELGTPINDGDEPRLVVLSNKGAFLAAQPLVLGKDGKLDPGALGAFLLANKPPTRNAEAMLSDGLARAKAEDKPVFLLMGGSWCPPCRMLGRFLDANRVELDRHYVFVKLDVIRDAHSSRLEERYQGEEGGGAPWYVILDPAGKPLVTSNAPELRDEYSSNIGFPTSKDGINHLMNMFRQTAPGISDDALAVLRRGLDKKP